MAIRAHVLLPLLPLLVSASQDPRKQPSATPPAELWAFDRYLDYDGLTAHVRDLAQRFPRRAVLHTAGQSIEGRELWVLELTERSEGSPETKSAAFAMGALHGNEASSTMTMLFMAWQCAANPGRSRGVDRAMRNSTLYLMPAANPDGLHHFITEPHSYWRPRYNYLPHDADGDGAVDEDGYEDLDGDGEISLMYRRDPEGAYTLQAGRMVRGKGETQYTLVGREGIDNDGDGRYSEDRPGGVDLNRNFPVGFRARKTFEGTTGAKALSEPETRAITGFVERHPNIALFLDYHNAARCVFHWTKPAPEADLELYAAMTDRAHEALGYEPKPLTHDGAGLSVAWVYGQLGLLALLVELEPGRLPEAEYHAKVWKSASFVPPRLFRHPQLGSVVIGNDYTKLAKRNPHPSDITWLAERNWTWLRKELAGLPRLVFVDPRIVWDGHRFAVTGRVQNTGKMPVDTAHARAIGREIPVVLRAAGATLRGAEPLGSLGPGEERAFRVLLEDPQATVWLHAVHPRGGTARLAVRQPRVSSVPVRKHYEVEAGYATAERARRADNEFFKDDRPLQGERGAAFEVAHRKPDLRVAVLLGEWKDQRHRFPAEAFERAFFSNNGYTETSPTGQQVYGSLRDFYHEMSYGQLRVSGEVFDWVEIGGTYAGCRDASFGSPIVQDRLTKAVLERHGADALDGFDGFVFVWAGNAVKRTSALWPMRLKLRDRPGTAAFKMGELHLGEFAPIGVACHEMGHTFGVSDKYGLGATRNPLGAWCLMGRGTHGATPSGRHRPFYMCAWCKSMIGWVRPTVIDPAEPQQLALRPTLFGPRECYRILLKPDGSDSLLLENRRCEGFLTDLPSAGLVVLRVGPNDLPKYPQTRVQLLTAHGKPPVRRGSVADHPAVAWPQPGKTELMVEGTALRDIRVVDDVVYFEVGPSSR